ncbi:MAG: fatty acid desaturase [Candidatus Puniceispirillales bacterium WSBS_2018_MAG_OTU23]
MTLNNNHRQFIKTLDQHEFSSLTQRTNIHGLMRLFIHLNLLMGCLYMMAVAATLPLYLIAAMMTGILGVFLFTPMHEASHFTAFKSRWLNHLVTHGVGFLLVLPPCWFHYFHMAHHQYTQDPSLDPELTTPKPTSWRQYLWVITGLPVWFSQARTLFCNAFVMAKTGAGARDDYVPPAKRQMVRIEARVMLGLYAIFIGGSIAANSMVMIYFWVIPMLMGQPFLRMYLLAEHTGCDNGGNMFKNTRTTLTSWPIRVLAWNMPYHVEHHCMPSVPFHQLPRLHKKSAGFITHLNDGYPSVHREIIKAFKKD